MRKLTDVQDEWNKRMNENHIQQNKNKDRKENPQGSGSAVLQVKPLSAGHNQHSNEISVKSIVISGKGKKKQLPEQSGKQDVPADIINESKANNFADEKGDKKK